MHTQNTVLIEFNSKLSKLAEINKGAWHGCTLLPTLLNTYFDEIITKWQKEDIKGIPLPKKQQLLTQLFADQVVIVVIISDTEDNLQKAAYELNGLITEHSLTLSARKTKLMAFKGLDPVTS
jgi:hypothetical protein